MRVRARRIGATARVALRRPTGARRPLPDFLVIGGQRCGTTTLYDALSNHPSVLPPVRKEIQYFTANFAKGEGWYRSHFPTAAERSRVDALTFEATPYYLFHRDAPARAAATVPKARLIALLRNPIDRAVSHYLHTRGRGLEPLLLLDALDAEHGRLRAGGAAQQLHSYAARGRYAEQLERWFAHFDRAQVLVVRSEDLFTDPPATIARVAEFVGLPPAPQIASAPPGDRPPRPDGEAAARDRLRAEFAGPNRELAALLGTDQWWDD